MVGLLVAMRRPELVQRLVLIGQNLNPDGLRPEIRAMLQSFIGRMGSVAPSVWGGVAAARFRDVVERWNAESMKLHAALQRIAETIRYNERTLREAGESHSHQIGSVATNL